MNESLSHFDSLLIIIGMAGAGKTTTMGMLGDSGYSCVDNLPVSFIKEFLNFTKNTAVRFRRCALLIDIDSEESVREFVTFLSEIAPFPRGVQVLFLDATTQTIVKRYSETRRPHPVFDPTRDVSLTDGIERQRTLLAPVKDRVSHVIDSTDLNSHLLRQEVRNFVESLPNAAVGTLRINFVSFGFKHGIPFDCDLLIDVRFLKNPFFIDHLRAKDGRTAEVASYVLETEEGKEFVSRYADLLNYLIPLYTREGKAYVNIGVGCTGGKHRSVAISEELKKRIHQPNCLVSVRHRDLDQKRN